MNPQPQHLDTARDTTDDITPRKAPLHLPGPLPTEPSGEPIDEDIPLFADIDDLVERWVELQSAFVDDPRRSIEDADALVADILGRVTERLAQQRQHLEESWRAGGAASTEDLRLALQHYRSFFHRLLAK